MKKSYLIYFGILCIFVSLSAHAEFFDSSDTSTSKVVTYITSELVPVFDAMTLGTKIVFCLFMIGGILSIAFSLKMSFVFMLVAVLVVKLPRLSLDIIKNNSGANFSEILRQK